jgi:hypothetical protein
MHAEPGVRGEQHHHPVPTPRRFEDPLELRPVTGRGSATGFRIFGTSTIGSSARRCSRCSHTL